ncbi:MAG: (Fe-S)-binding protein, partial [Anaerolineae bacterium]|nr:(Fe-S)-binding protein [Anaerolineae bacterium]MDW8072409.1 (Fe-S)-binding protein [Anaerolineae bacterium]
LGRAEKRWDQLPIRIWRLIAYAIVQVRVLSQRYPGIMHVALAWAFFVFLWGTILATIHSHFVSFLRGHTYLVYKLGLDVFTAVFIVGAILAAYRRYILRPRRLTLAPRFTYSLVLIVVIVVGGLNVEATRLAVERPEWAWWMPAGWLVAQLWLATGASDATLLDWHFGLWFFHLLSVALLFVTLPQSTMLHVVTGPLNVFFSKLDRPMGRLAAQPQTASGEPLFVTSLRDLTWKQLLDSEACTECGRCQDACPAFAAGMPLSPKELMLNIRTALRRDGPQLLQRSNGANSVPALVGEVIQDAVLWSCTTCGACVRECPVLIEHIDTMVDMRRQLVNEGRMDSMLQETLANLGRYGNSFGQSERVRGRWAQAFDPPIKDARKESVEYLWFVGDYASYSATLTDITRKTAEVFQKLGLDFGILYDGERNAGNDVRRVGEEGLYEMLMHRNTTVLGRCSFKAIVTTDPHSYNTLKNEYPPEVRDGRPVLHYTELLDHMLLSGALKFSRRLGYTVTYSDPCYLGRYNGVYDAPRRLILATGCQLVEMPRCGDRAACCGAGGGRIWMEEQVVRERPSEARIREAAALEGVQMLVVTCPKDVTMYRDAVKTTGYESRLAVKELIELVHAAL